ncbi:hypothetical protein HW555_006271 [Spodoptera exigua]|uniref:Uncharacterized protein n=1 Tax=Spodoptera exigua TaxID=7107 RepID=A0A835LA69_SPOEX|nr:hypothetical protein HW555_006271 [Spodoptera exigua]
MFFVFHQLSPFVEDFPELCFSSEVGLQQNIPFCNAHKAKGKLNDVKNYDTIREYLVMHTVSVPNIITTYDVYNILLAVPAMGGLS